MKQITLNLRKKLMLVELPEVCDNVRVWHDSPEIIYYDDPNGYDGINSINLDYDIGFIGLFKSIPESYWEGVVLSQECEGAYPFADIYFLDHVSGNYGISNMKDSILSAIKAEGWYVDGNPYMKRYFNPEEYSEDEYNEFMEAQEKVINLNNVWVFERKEVGYE